MAILRFFLDKMMSLVILPKVSPYTLSKCTQNALIVFNVQCCFIPVTTVSGGTSGGTPETTFTPSGSYTATPSASTTQGTTVSGGSSTVTSGTTVTPTSPTTTGKEIF